MTDSTITEVIPIYTDDDGRMRVSGTRVLLDLVVFAFHQGQTPEHMVQMYPTLTLDKVYLALGYYLRHRREIDLYIRRMEERAEADCAAWDALQGERADRPTQAEMLARLAAKQRQSGEVE